MAQGKGTSAVERDPRAEGFRVEDPRRPAYLVLRQPDVAAYVRLNSEDEFLWQQMDGRASIQEMATAYVLRYGRFDFDVIPTLIRKLQAAGFLARAIGFYADHGIRIERVLTDNGSCYRSQRFAATCRRLGIRQLFTRPYTPRTNGKAERFIQTLQNRWAHGAIYANSTERTAALPGWLTHYNFTRRHGSLAHKPPAARLAELEQRPG